MIAHFVIFCVVVAAAVSIPFIVGAIVVLHVKPPMTEVTGFLLP